jgi:hypothetical protein
MNSIKQIILLLVATLTFTMPGQCASPEADVKQVTENFYKQYYRDFINKKGKESDYDARLIKWVNASPDTSPRFKKAVPKAFSDARKKDPELGLESDPILAGQDYPEKGYRAKTVKITNGKAAVGMVGLDAKGAETKDFHISLELVNAGGRWLIDRIADIPPGK